MKLLKMKNEKGGLDYMVKLETKAEWRIHENFVSYGRDRPALDSMIRSCDHASYIMGDDDIVYYFGVLEREPAMGESFELDDIRWERIG